MSVEVVGLILDWASKSDGNSFMLFVAVLVLIVVIGSVISEFFKMLGKIFGKSETKKKKDTAETD